MPTMSDTPNPIMPPTNMQAVSNTEKPDIRPICRDPTYFFDLVVFKVEDTLFSVPKHHFSNIPVFSTIFTLPTPDGCTAEGSSESNPFELQGVSKKDFLAFLTVLYPLKVPHSYTDITLDEWKSVLALSSMWDFQSLRDLSIQTLSASGLLDSVSKILLGEKHEIHDWFISGCAELVMRQQGPRADEIALLGMQTAVRIYDLREPRISAQLRKYYYDPRFQVQRAFQDVLGPITSDC